MNIIMKLSFPICIFSYEKYLTFFAGFCVDLILLFVVVFDSFFFVLVFVVSCKVFLRKILFSRKIFPLSIVKETNANMCIFLFPHKKHFIRNALSLLFCCYIYYLLLHGY